MLPRKPVKVALFLITVRFLAPRALLEPWLFLREGDLELPATKMSAMDSLLELLRALKLLEAHRNDAIFFLVEQCDVCDFTERLGFLAHVFFDLKDGGVVFVEFGEGECVPQDAYFCPFILLGREGLGDFFFVVGPLCEFAVSQSARTTLQSLKVSKWGNIGVRRGCNAPIQLRPIALTRLLILPRQLTRNLIPILMLLIAEIRLLHLYDTLRLILDPEVVFVHHPDGQVDAVLLKVHDQRVAVEVSFVVFVHFNPLVAVCALVDDAVFFEFIFDFGFVGVAREVADVDCAVFLDFGLFVGLL